MPTPEIFKRPHNNFWRIKRETRTDIAWALRELAARLEKEIRAAIASGERTKAAELNIDCTRLAMTILAVSPTHKICLKCGPQPVTNFYVQRRSKYGEYLQAHCKDCNTVLRREQNQKKKKALEIENAIVIEPEPINGGNP